MNVAQIVGWSGAGKTMLVVELIRLFVARGLTVGAIKHTHHDLNELDVPAGGDTAMFLAAGASTVILAAQNEATDGTSRLRYETPPDLLDAFTNDIVIIEGFKSFTGWPRIEVRRDARPSAAEVAAILDRIWRSSS
jgi:molybdopterin-guanine dinucleotide biosynthesis protein B